ncbi:MAG TPA: FAD-dependent oxidoreductase, partial [Actinomycetota bacterium]
GTPVVGLGPDGDAVRVATTTGEIAADGVILAVPAGAAAIVLSGVAPEAAGPLGEVEYRGSVVVHLRWRAGSLRRSMDAAGYLVAPEEGGAVAACSWLNGKWPHLGLREPRARAIVVDPATMAAPDEELGGRVAEETGRVLGAREAPLEVRVRRWGEAMPVFAPGHRARVAAARAALPRGIVLAGAAYDGIGLPDCIRSGEAAGRGVVARLGGA